MLNSLYPWIYFDMAAEGGGSDGGDDFGDGGDSDGGQQEENQSNSDNSSSNPGNNPLLYQGTGNPYADPFQYAANQESLPPLPPPAAPRHHAISTYRNPLSQEAFVWINVTAVTYGGLSPVPGFDSVISIEDNTPGLPVNPSVVNNNLPVPRVGLKYNSSNSPQVVGNSQYAQQRVIKVTWASGFTKDFQMLVPGTEQAGGQYVEAGATVDDGVLGYGPVTPGDYDWRGGLKYTSSAPQINNNNLVFSKTNELADPASVYRNGESIYLANQTGSNVLFDINTSDNTSSANTATGGCTGGHLAMATYGDPDYRALPDKLTLPEQTFETIVISYSQTILSGASNLGLRTMGLDQNAFGNTMFAIENVTWNNLHSGLSINSGGNVVNEPFSHTITYSENLFTPPVTSTSINVCDDSSSSNYYLTTCKDCNGNTIPGCPNNISSTLQLNASQCCSPCRGTLNFGTHFDQCVTYGVNDGIFRAMITTVYPGTPWPSGSLYTWTITHSLGASFTQTAPPTGGNDFDVSCTTNVTSGTEHQVTSTSSTRIATGMIVTGTGIPANTYVGEILTPAQPAATIGVTKFELVDASGAIVSATSAATSTLTFAAGTTMVWRALAPNIGVGSIGGFYTITVLDYNGCDYSYSFTLCQGYPTIDCTDTQAINYNSAANTACPSCCIFCNQSGLGQLSNQNSGYVGDLFDVTNTVNTQIATNDSTSDGQLKADASIISSAVPYLDLDGTQDYTMTLYKTTTFGGSIGGLSATATQTGLALNGTSPSHIFTGLAYGYYAVKVQLVDSDEVHGLEDCYTVFYGKVQAYVCDDPNSSTYNTTVPIDLAVHDPALCTTLIDCCELYNLNIVYAGCDTTLTADLRCEPRATQVIGYWTFNGSTISGSGFTLINPGASGLSLVPININGPGLYEIHITASYSTAGTAPYLCNKSLTINVRPTDFLICGCTDPPALNYNILANADCIGVQGGSNFSCCIYCIYGCMDPTANNYDPLATCDDGSCTWDIYGCTDPLATNYNPAATIDDESCTYAACLDHHAANYLEDCQGNLVPNATINNASCCFYPCTDPITGQPSNPATLTAVTVDSTGTCTTPISDGTATITVTINSGAPTWTIYYTDGAGTTLYTDSTIYSGSGSATIWTGLAPGVYKAIVTDSYGCVDELLFAVSSSPIDVGCTDPAATNYDPNADCDDGSCIFCGCMDPMAINYNPGATCDDGTCIYPAMRLGDCIPATIEDTLNRIRACTLKRGSEFLKDIKLGINEDCFTLNKWKLILIEYLLGRYKYGLDCLFNCEDEETPEPPPTCDEDWVTGGPVTGVNDQAYAGSSISTGEGTTITDPSLYFVSGNTLFNGDVIKMPNGIIYTFWTPSPGGRQAGGLNPVVFLGTPGKEKWVICNPAYELNITTTTNYIDNFINFVNIFCEDCDIETDYEVTGGQPVEPTYKRTLDFTQNNITFNF